MNVTDQQIIELLKQRNKPVTQAGIDDVRRQLQNMLARSSMSAQANSAPAAATATATAVAAPPPPAPPSVAAGASTTGAPAGVALPGSAPARSLTAADRGVYMETILDKFKSKIGPDGRQYDVQLRSFIKELEQKAIATADTKASYEKNLNVSFHHVISNWDRFLEHIKKWDPAKQQAGTAAASSSAPSVPSGPPGVPASAAPVPAAAPKPAAVASVVAAAAQRPPVPSAAQLQPQQLQQLPPKSVAAPPPAPVQAPISRPTIPPPTQPQPPPTAAAVATAATAAPAPTSTPAQPTPAPNSSEELLIKQKIDKLRSDYLDKLAKVLEEDNSGSLKKLQGFYNFLKSGDLSKRRLTLKQLEDAEAQLVNHFRTLSGQSPGTAGGLKGGPAVGATAAASALSSAKPAAAAQPKRHSMFGLFEAVEQLKGGPALTQILRNSLTSALKNVYQSPYCWKDEFASEAPLSSPSQKSQAEPVSNGSDAASAPAALRVKRRASDMDGVDSGEEAGATHVRKKINAESEPSAVPALPEPIAEVESSGATKETGAAARAADPLSEVWFGRYRSMSQQSQFGRVLGALSAWRARRRAALSEHFSLSNVPFLSAPDTSAAQSAAAAVAAPLGDALKLSMVPVLAKVQQELVNNAVLENSGFCVRADLALSDAASGTGFLWCMTKPDTSLPFIGQFGISIPSGYPATPATVELDRMESSLSPFLHSFKAALQIKLACLESPLLVSDVVSQSELVLRQLLDKER